MTLTRRLWGYIALAVAGAALGVWLVTLWLPGWLVGQRTRDGAAAPGNPPHGAPRGPRPITATPFCVSPIGMAVPLWVPTMTPVQAVRLPSSSPPPSPAIILFG